MEEVSIEGYEAEEKEALFNELLTKHGQEILQLCYSYVKDPSIAEDLTQDIFVKCYKSLHTYSGKSKLRTWLWRIAINHCKDYLKSWYHKNVVMTEKESFIKSSSNRDVEDLVVQKDEDTRLASAVMNLPVTYREIIYLFYFEELSIKEISFVIKKNENTVKTRLRRAKKLLKKRLEE
ncbi:sigma-70 family RNA polymerase sigma factor [Bacillus spongiae]|uniref:Sigma-70 family RNA polymerase sigma factor n=1 Tax=Bacillus spongiae TaxID=2683610 RepID=A0ABU8H8Q3_9BACI